MSIITLNSGTSAHFVSQGSDVQASINLDKLSDVTITNLLSGQILRYDGSQGQWVNEFTGNITSLDHLSDVQSLQYDNATGNWVNRDITANSIDGGTY